jgi:ABC-type nitrate/sulfonate/bicarbonate transport system substrate-binding protein
VRDESCERGLRAHHGARDLKRGILVVAMLAMTAMTVASCGGSSGGGGSQTMTVGVQTKVLQTYYPQLAEKLGYFKKEGLKVNVIESQSPAAAIQGLLGGSLNVYLGGPEALPAAAKGADVRLIAASSNRSIFDIVTSKDIQSIAQLKGKTFGVSETTSISTATSKQALRKNGVNPDDLKYVVAGGSGNRFTALQSNRIDAAPLGTPLNYQAASIGLNDLGSTDTTLGAPPIATVMFTVGKRWADSHKDTLQRFLRAYQQVVDALHDPSMTEKIVSAAGKDLKVDPKYTRRAVKSLFLDKKNADTVLPRDGHIDPTALQNAADALVEVGSLPKKIDASKYVDDSYLKAAQKSLK